MRILLLEDNERLGQLVCEHLSQSRYVVDVSTCIADFRACAEYAHYDLYIFDLGLPDGDALQLIRDLRHGRCRVPILITSGRGQVNDRIAGLDVGADDYLVKPYNCNELIARVRALLRRPHLIERRLVTVGSLGLDNQTGDIHFDGELLDLPASERRLLALLMKRRNQLVPKPVIENLLTKVAAPSTPNAIEKLVSRLRRRINASMGVEVKTIRGDGYRLVETQ
jgi:two-component system, OmpR family, response regulator QseB